MPNWIRYPTPTGSERGILISIKKYVYCGGNYTSAIPPGLYCVAATRNLGGASRGRLTPGSSLPTILCRGGHITETPISYSSTSLPEGNISSTPGPASTALTLHPASAAPTPPFLVVPTTASTCPAFTDLASPPTSTTPRNDYFVPGIKEALPYADLEQAT